MEYKKLSNTSELRDFWRCYDVLQSTQRYYLNEIYDIYGGPDKYRQGILSEKILVLYVQEEVGRILGAVSATIEASAHKAHIGYFHMILKGRGHGSKLLENVCQELKEIEISSVSILCRMDLKAYKFYQKHGFEDITETTRKLRRMEKEISSI